MRIQKGNFGKVNFIFLILHFKTTTCIDHLKIVYYYSFQVFELTWQQAYDRKNHCTAEHTQFCNSNLHSCISSPISTFN